MALADFRSYVDAQDRVEAAYRDEDAWTRSAILNVARTGFFRLGPLDAGLPGPHLGRVAPPLSVKWIHVVRFRR
ncbi:hypothetical protein GCM10025876_17780 [Demequina litorisediminis]|uniref:Uncharacterized protein n=1 Tax=Demequina litorisediminis TaxID=1849022 RepID=A0ABQ6ICP6_9MICO|nr:hypothetical protein GCM10025876_17780 [Demequina litorisediminis]